MRAVTLFIILLVNFTGLAQQPQPRRVRDMPFEQIQAIYEKKIHSFERSKAVIGLNELLLADFSEEQKNILKIYKLKALVSSELFDAAMEQANELLARPTLTTEMEISILLERSLMYELLNKMPESKKDLNRVARFYAQSLIQEDHNFGIYLFRLSSWFRVNDRPEEAEKWSDKAISYGRNHRFKDVEATGYMLLGLITDSLNVEQRIIYFSEGLQLCKQDNHKPGTVNTYFLIARTYLGNSDYKLAKIYNDSALQLINKEKSDYVREDIYKQRSSIYESQDQKDSALTYQKLYIESKLLSLSRSRNIKVREYEYAYNKEKAVVKNIKLANELENATSNENYLLYGLMIAALFLISLGLLFITLATRNRKISDQNSAIKFTNYKLSQTIEEKEFLLQEVNHRVKNNLAFIQSLIAFQMEESTIPETVENLKSLNNRIEAIAIVHDQFVEANHAMAHKEVPIKTYVGAITDALIQVNNEELSYLQDIGDIKLNLETAVPIGILINELLTNSIKHAAPVNQPVEIRLNIEDLGKQISIIYSDNGNDFIVPADSQSLGLYIIKTMVRQLRGTFEREGSTYRILVRRKHTP